MSDLESQIYSKNVIDFLTIGVEFCSFLEGDSVERALWSNTMARILPLLYLKATLVEDEISSENEEIDAEMFVSEEDYLIMVNKISSILGEEDVYLDVFVDEMKYSDTPIASLVSEDVADIYQDIRNFVSAYKYGISENINSALYVCMFNFRTYWGQKLVNVLRPLHTLRYAEDRDEKENDVQNYLDAWE